MHPTLLPHFEALERRTADFLARLEALSPEARAFRPHAAHWSLDEVAQHLWLVERGALHILVTRADKPPIRAGLLVGVRAAVLRWGLRRGVRIKAPIEAIRPKAGMTLAQVQNELATTLRQLRAHLDAVPPGRLGHKIFRHPIGGPMNVEESLDFLVKHHDHHMRQVERITAAPGFPG